MGAGCFYTHNHTEIENPKAFWIDIDYYDETKTDAENHIRYITEWDCLIDNLKYIFKEIGYDQHYKDKYKYSNGLATIELESTYYGDGLVVRLEPNHVPDGIYDAPEDVRRYNLFLANHERMYNRIKRELLKYYSLRIATSGYTSTEIKAA